MKWSNITINTPDGQRDAIAPLIISASRATDIPAFHSDWFFHRFSAGYCVWLNPFNNKKSFVSFENTKAVVFWSKNPAPMIGRIDELNRFGFCYYFQFTLNDYSAERFEPNLPSLENRIETFRTLSRMIGKERVIWRFDPILLGERLTSDEILARIKRIGDLLAGYTQKLVISFADIDIYPRVRNNLQSLSISCRELTPLEISVMAEQISDAARNWKMSVASCSEVVDLELYGIEHNRCIDPDLLLRLCRDETLSDFLVGSRGQKSLLGEQSFDYDRLKDKGQRKQCGCVWSKDIGQYNTCPHYCVYCYANKSKKLVERNIAAFLPTAESILAEKHE